MGGPEFAALLLPDVQELLTNGAVRPIVRKKAALALLRLLRKSASDVEELLQHDVRRLLPRPWTYPTLTTTPTLHLIPVLPAVLRSNRRVYA